MAIDKPYIDNNNHIIILKIQLQPFSTNLGFELDDCQNHSRIHVDASRTELFLRTLGTLAVAC